MNPQEGEHYNEAYESAGDAMSIASSDGDTNIGENSDVGQTVMITESNDGAGPQLRANLALTSPRVLQNELMDKSENWGEQEEELKVISSSDRDGFVISWHNLDYVLESKWWKLSGQRKPILNALSGTFKSGELSAILGPSGAGKSTFIDCLVGKHERGLKGQTKVTFASSIEDPTTKSSRKKRPLRIAVIPQEDHLMDSLTVKETFMFASRMKNAHLQYAEELDESVSSNSSTTKSKRQPFDHKSNVQRVINQLNLTSCSNLKCGKLSGGQYKRVSIGQELLSRPDLMILDEPTSGLDSVTCFQTIKALRQLIESSVYPIAIVATIHQPDVEVFQLFHKAYVLANGGRAIYEGPVDQIFDTCQQGLDLVRSRRKQPHWKLSSSPLSNNNSLDDLAKQLEERRSNPARLVVEVAANEYGFDMVVALNELHCRRHQFSDWSGSESQSSPSDSGRSTNSDNLATSSVSIDQQVSPSFHYYDNDPMRRKAQLDKRLDLSRSSQGSRSVRVYLKHMVLNMQRSWLTILRDPMLFSLQVLLHILVPLLISYSYSGAQETDACPKVGPLDVIEEAYREGNILEDLNLEIRAAFENLGYMFFQIYIILFAAVCITSLTYPLIMHVLLKEYRNGWYSLSSYFLGRTLADLPVPTFNVVIAMAISYHLTGQALSPYGWRFACVAIVTVLATLAAQTIGLMCGALLMNAAQSAVFVAPASTAPMVVVSGFLFRIKTMPYLLQILSKFSFITHLLNGFIVARYGFNRCPCSEQDFQIPSEHQIPQQARSVIDIWIDTFGNEYSLVNGTKPDLVGKLVDTISLAKSFGHNMTDCSQVKPFTMLDYELEDSDLLVSILALLAMFFCLRWLTYVTLAWKIRSSI